MSDQFKLPGLTIYGENALGDSESVIKEMGKKAFIVTDKVMVEIGLVKKLTDYLDKWGILHEIFDGITGEPTDVMIECGIKTYSASGCDFIMAIGGGSSLDSAKAIGAMTSLEGAITEYMGKEIKGDFPPTVLIPTTAGTGSEATKFTVITDTKNDVKMLLKGDDLLPELAVIDSQFSMTSPKSITAATGMDALTHAVESYTSRRGNTMTDMYALSSIKRIFKYLPEAFDDGKNVKAREEMSIAAYEAGVCINNASVTIVHGMSRPIGALFHVPHGISNAMLIAECLTYVIDGCYDKFARIAREIEVAGKDDSDKDAAGKFIEALKKLCIKVEIPTLKEYGIDKKEFDTYVDKMAEDAMNSGSPSNTIKEVTKADLIKIYNKLW